MLRLRRVALPGLLLLLLAPSLSLAAGVTAVFDVASPAKGPFPSDRYTVPDATHNTGPSFTED